MFQHKTKAKASAKSQLKPGVEFTKVVQMDDGLFGVITPTDELEPCLEQVVGDWTKQGDKKVWNENTQFDPNRILI